MQFRYIAAVALGLCVLAPARHDAPRLWAQGCTTLDPPCPPNQKPSVVITPATGTFSTSSIPVTVYLSDDGSLNPGSLTASPSVSFSGSWGPGNASATLTGTLALSPGSNVFVVDITDSQGLHGADTVTLVYTPPPPPPAQDSAVLSLAAYSNTIRQLEGCSGCLYGSAQYATPAYVSRDQARSVALLYSSAQATPMDFVQVDATVNASTTPDRISLRLLQGGSPVSLTNGGTEAFYTGATGTVRLGAQFDASGLSTGFYNYVAKVRTWWGGTSYESTIPVRVLVINTQASVYGAGWSIAGVQHLWTNATDSVAISDGSGRIVFFARNGATTFAATAGDFTTLTVSGGVYTRKSVDGSFARFNSSGLMTATGTRFGDSTTYAYDGSGRLTTITDEAGQVTSFTYAPHASCLMGAASGTLCAITTPGSRVSKFVVNGSNDLVQVLDPDGITAFTGTYSSHKLTASTDRLGGITRQTYDAFSGLASLTLPAVTTTAPGGSTTTDSATTNFQTIEAALLATSNSSSGSARGVVRADTAYAKIIAPNGTVAKMVLQGAWEPTALVVQPITGAAQTTVTAYNANFLPTSITSSPVGGTTLFTWNGSDLVNTTDPNGVRTEFAYESTFHQPTTVHINGVLQETGYYSGAFVTLDSTVAGQAKTTFTWDSHGRVTGTNDRQGHTTTAVYASGGFQNTQQAWIAGNITSFVHDRFGRDSVVTDAQSHANTLLYDLLNRPTSLVQPGSATTTTSYSENTSTHTLTTTLTDPRSLTFTTVTNVLGWPTTITDPQSAASTAGFDRNGFLRRAVNRLSNAVTFNYDSLGRVVSRTANSLTATFAYDGATTATDPHWAVAANAESRDSVATDATGRVVSERSTRGIGTFTSTTTYDAVGNRRKLTITNGTWTDSLVFGNDSVQYPRQLPDFGGSWTLARYNSEQLLDTLIHPTGTASTRLRMRPSSYGAFHRPGWIDVYAGTVPRERWWFAYDELGRLTEIDSGGIHDYVERQFTYDARGRLAAYADHHIYADSVQQPCPGGEIICDPPPPWDYTWHDDVIRSATYSPDHSGNRTDGGASLSNDRLASMTGANGQTYAFSYDAEGRLLSKTGTGYSQTYGWNDLGQLLWVKTNGDSVAFGYDALGRRVRKWHAGSTTGYLWDGDQLLMELDGSGGRTFQYSYQAGIDRPVAVRTGGSTYYYQLDETGNVAAVWNTSNTKVATYTYDPYGYLIATTGGLTQPLRWKGREYDSETGLYYIRARYYDPTVGRFLSEDPLGVSAGINPYTFADGEPVNRSDPSGMCDPYKEITYTDDQGETHTTKVKVVCSEVPATPWFRSFLERLTGRANWMEGWHPDGDPESRMAIAGMPWYVGGTVGGGSSQVRALPEIARVTKRASAAFSHLARFNGIPKWLASERLHAIKRAAGLGGRDNVLFDFSGGVWHAQTREWLGSLTEGGARGWRP